MVSFYDYHDNSFLFNLEIEYPQMDTEVLISFTKGGKVEYKKKYVVVGVELVINKNIEFNIASSGRYLVFLLERKGKDEV